MISRFFIDRPIFASVLSILIVLAGALALLSLPIAQYPPIAPPTVQVSCVYPGASAQVVADTIAAPIEQQVNGVENMLYMSSQCGNDGSYTLIVTFDLATDLNTALVMVQNRVSLAMPQLPNSVQQQGLTIKKKSPNILLLVNLFSTDGRYDDLYMSNYATINVKDELFRLEGIGDINYLGQRDYSIRVWLDPQRLAARGISAMEVTTAIQNQSLAAAPGQVAQQPGPAAPGFQTPIEVLGRLTDPEQYGEIIVKTLPATQNSIAPQFVRLRDVARIELGAQQYSQFATTDGRPTVGLAIYQLPGTNALDVANRVRAKMEQLKKRFPDGLDYGIYYDTTPFIEESVQDVVKTLLEAIVLVAIVVLAFLQSWRATLIPLIAVPVAIVGTFAVMAIVGFSLNNISLFGLVLAIGIVVDDAIVVVENVERWLAHGLSPREAARKAMDEVTGPVIAVALVLCAVFIPCAFISGITGQFFRQFAVTIAVSTVFSAVNSLTLSPALAVILLRPHGARKDILALLLSWTLGWFFQLFNWTFDKGTLAYTWLVGWLLRLFVLVLIVYAGLLCVTYYLFVKVPTGFVPQQDQGWCLVSVQLPDSASVQRTQQVMRQIEEIARKIPGVEHTNAISGLSVLLSSNSSNFGSMFVILSPFKDRKTHDLHADAIMAKLRKEFAAQIRDATVMVFGAAPVPGIGMASGFKLMVEDRGSLGLQPLQENTDVLIREALKVPGLLGVSTMFRSNTPQLHMEIDRAKAKALGVSVDDLNNTLQTYLGSTFANNFNQFGRYWQVNVQADLAFRDQVEAINLLQVRNNRGQMVPVGTLVRVRDMGGPVMITRYNLYPAAAINGVAHPLYLSSGQAISILDNLADKNLPRSMKTEWTELTYMQIKAGNTAMYVFAAAVVFVFLVLAAQYESWTLPLAVILVVPMCLLCSIVGVVLRHLAMDIFVQIGFVVLVGLACKNAILIVEFAKQLREEGQSCFVATVQACGLRLRPILMTSFAFILGVVPMVIAEGAGAEMRWSLGTAVFSGMLGVTLFGILLTPVFFYVIESIGDMSMFRPLVVQWLVSSLVGGSAGLLMGYLAYKIGFPQLHWALVGGFALGAGTAVLVQQHRRRRNSQLKS